MFLWVGWDVMVHGTMQVVWYSDVTDGGENEEYVEENLKRVCYHSNWPRVSSLSATENPTDPNSSWTNSEVSLNPLSGFFSELFTFNKTLTCVWAYLIQKTAQGPDIWLKVVSVLMDPLRWHVVRRAHWEWVSNKVHTDKVMNVHEIKKLI